MINSNSGSASPTSARSRKEQLDQIPFMKKPNVDEYKSQIEVGQKDINELHKRLDEMANKINGLTKGNSEFQKKRDDLRKNLDTIQHQMDGLEAERNRVVSQIEDTARTGRDMKSKVQGLKRSLGFQTNEEIDAKIRQIERHMMAKRLTVPEENKFISEIRQLEKSKPLVVKYASMEADANNHSQTAVLPLRIRLDEIKDELKVCQKKKRDLSESWSALMQARNKTIAPVRDLSDEKDQLKRQIVEKRAQVNQLRDEMYKRQREYEVYQAKVDRVQYELRQEERKRRQAERTRQLIQTQLEDIDEEAWSPELQLTNQIVIYLRKLVEKTKTMEQIEMSEEKDTEKSELIPEAQDGMVMMKPKKDREEEYYFKPTKKKAEKKTKKSALALGQPLVHDITTLADFSRLLVDAPLTLQECPALLNTLEEKLESLKKEHSRSSETTQRRRAELLAKLEALEEAKPAKAMDVPPVEVEAA